MRYTTIISDHEAHDHMHQNSWVFVDCRYSLQNREQGRLAYQKSHIPGAIYADLERDLSGKYVPGVTGRHPLPGVIDLTERFSEWGIDQSIQVVVYDDQSGAIAARLWWLLNWLGHDSVAVMDGGWQRWINSGYPVEHRSGKNTPRRFTPRLNSEYIFGTEEIAQILNDYDWQLVDARAAHRYDGENETIDPIAGHIPSAISIPYEENLTTAGSFKIT